jgi:hypothetical protein
MPGKCKFFAWLVLHGRCWTSDRLHHHGLKDSDTCALCAQEVKTLDHLLVDCVFSRETWFRTLTHILLPQLAPDRPTSLATWWCSARKSVAKTRRKGFDTFVWLVAWSIWRGAQSACSWKGGPDASGPRADNPRRSQDLGTRGLPPNCSPPWCPVFEASVALFFLVYSFFYNLLNLVWFSLSSLNEKRALHFL